MSVLFNAAIQALLWEDPSRCQALCDEYLFAAKELNLRGAQIASLYLSGYACLGRADYATAAAVFSEGLAGTAETGNRHGCLARRVFGAGPVSVSGEYDRAEAALHTAFETFGRD